MNTVREVVAVAVVALCLMVGCNGAGVDANTLPADPSGPANPARQSLDVAPSQVDVQPAAQLKFAATVSSANVVWSVSEGAAGGTITGDGVYTAPSSPGTYHIVATTTGTASRTGTAVVTVGASDASSANVRAFGAVGDGVTDDTAAFQAAAATGKDLFIPGTSAHYKLTGRVDVHGSVRGDGSMPEIRMYGATGSRDHAHTIFALDDYSGPGAVFSGLHLNGQWDGGASGEWDHGIQIQASSNVTIENNLIENAYGDDIVLDQLNGAGSANVIVRNNTLKNPRRCAVAIIAAVNVVVDGNTISKQNNYVSAVDLEPDPGTNDAVGQVQITSNTFAVATTAVLLYNWDGMPTQSDVTVTGNSGSAGSFYQSVGAWNAVNVSGNAF